MASFSYHGLAVLFGILGNIMGLLVYLAPIITFYEIYQRRSTQNYHALPYSVALFSAMLMLYYAYLKGHNEAIHLIIINSFGIAIETAYLITFFTLANSRIRKATTKLVIAFNVGLYMAIVSLTWMISPVHHRVKVVGCICAIISVCVYAAPLSAMRTVIRTKNVNYMPFPLSVCLTQNAIIWFFYGVFSHDYFIAMPNLLGFIFGAAQIIIHLIYRKSPSKSKPSSETENQNEANTTNDASLCMVAGEIIELVDTMSHRANHSDEDTKATTTEWKTPEIHESNNINDVTGTNNGIERNNEIHLVYGDEIIEIPDDTSKNSNVKFANNKGPNIKASVHNV